MLMSIGVLSLGVFAVTAQMGYLPERFLSLYALVLHAVKKRSHFAPRKERKFNFTQIQKGIIVGMQPRNEADIGLLRLDYGVTAILSLNEPRELYVPNEASSFNNLDLNNLSSNLPYGTLRDPKILRLNIPVADYQAPSQKLLEVAVKFIAAQVRNGGTVYVHCNGGKGRSVAAVMAYMLANDDSNSVSVKDAWKACKSRRKQASAGLVRYPFTPQSRSLEEFKAYDLKNKVLEEIKKAPLTKLATELPQEYITNRLDM